METTQSLHEFDQPGTPPANNMSLAIIGTVLGLCSPCCIGLIVGIIGIVQASSVNSKFIAGDYLGAASAAKSAKTMGYIAIGLGVLGLIINIITIIAFGGVNTYMEYIQQSMGNLGIE